ncbi:MAG: DUF938 domain-containing protein, partial [Pseudomonadota bacterium]
MIAPSAQRNLPAIARELTGLLAGLSGPVVEIGSGTGLHAAHLAQSLPHLTWIPSDPAPAHRASIEAWRRHLSPPNLRPPLALDATGPWWEMPEIAAQEPGAVFCANVIHIAPWPVACGIVDGAGHALGADGLLILYGPFIEDGQHTGEGNVRFDASLRLRNPEWGMRELGEVTGL